MTTARLDRGAPRAAVLTLLLASGAALGGLSAYGAYALHPLALPLGLAAAAAALVALQRPDIGIALALTLLAAGSLGVEAVRPWLPVTLWSGFLVLASLVRPGAGSERPAGRLPPVSICLLGYVVVAVLSFAVAEQPGAALPYVRIAVVGGALVVAMALAVRARAHVHWLLVGVSGAALLTGLATIGQRLTGSATVGFITSSGTLVDRATGAFNQPNQLAGFLVMLVPFTIAGIVLQPRARLYHAAALGAALFAIYASFSRGALIALVAGIAVLLRGRRAVAALAVVALIAAVAAPDLLRERFETLGRDGSEVATRVDIWVAAGQVWMANPLLGVGLGGFPEAYAELRLPGKDFLPDTAFEPPPHAHNLFLNVLAEQGVLGLVALLAVLAVSLRDAIRLRGSSDRLVRTIAGAGFASIVAFLVHNQLDVTLVESAGVMFLALLGLIGTVAARREQLASEGGRV